MKKKVQAIPKGDHTLAPVLCVKKGLEAIRFYKKAFGSVEHYHMMTPDGKHLVHAELVIGDSIVMLSEEMAGPAGKSPLALGGTPVSLYMYVKDVDAAYKRAVAAGAKKLYPVQDMFWGDRMGNFTDPFGHVWTLATHVEDVSPAEMKKRGKEWMAKMMK